MNAALAYILRRTAANALGLASAAVMVWGGWMLAVTPGLALWYDGRLTDLGALTVVPAIILAVFGLLWWIAPHLEVLAAGSSAQDPR